MTTASTNGTLTTITETTPVLDGLPLRLSFAPDAIREHFDGDDDDPTVGLNDAQLAEIGAAALTDDILVGEQGAPVYTSRPCLADRSSSRGPGRSA